MQVRKIDYSIVIPVYKSGEWMDELVSRIGNVMAAIDPDAFELILINDCSPDSITWAAVKRNARQHPWVRGFNLLYNVGQFRATLCGLKQAAGQFVITMDDDLQHPPEEIPKLIQAIHDGDALCVMGLYESKKHSRFRNLGSAMMQNIMNRLYGKPPGIRTTSFRIMKRDLVNAILSFRTARPQMGAVLVSLTREIINVTVSHNRRKSGKSGYGLRKLLSTTRDNIVSASTFPLRLFSIIGVGCALASFLLAIIFFIRWFTGGIRVAGYTSQILLIILFGGLTLAGIGILGEYISRIISELTGPEQYRIREDTDHLFH